MLGPSCRDHFSLQQLRPVHERPATFIVSQWQHDKSTPNIKYLLYRISVFITFFVCWIFTFVKEDPAGKPRWPIYLTNWGYTLCMIQALLVSIMVIVSMIAERVTSKSHWMDKILKMYPVYWVFNIIATPVAFTITIIYWLLIYGHEGTGAAAPTPLNIMVHGINSVLMFVDIWIVSHPIRIFHFLYPLFLALSYTIFTVIFYVAGGTTKTGKRYIYPILKWDIPGRTTAICLGVMLLMMFLHLFSFLAYKLRIKIYEILYLPNIDPPAPEKEPSGYVNKAMATEYV